jgi:hypothetical protein
VGIQHAGIPYRNNEDGHFDSNLVIKWPFSMAALFFWNFKKNSAPVWLFLLQMANVIAFGYFIWNRAIRKITDWNFYYKRACVIWGILFFVVLLCTAIDMAIYHIRKKRHEYDYYDPDYESKKEQK